MPKSHHRKTSKAAATAGAILITVLCAAWTMRVNDESKSAYISADKMNVLYIGLENPISVLAEGYSPEQLMISFVGATGRPTSEKLRYLINPDGSTRVCTIKLIDNVNKKLIVEQQFRIRPVPKPEVYLGTNSGPNISLADLQSVKKVYAGYGSTFPFEGMNFQVQGYTFTHAPKEGKGFYQVLVEGDSLTPEIKERLATVSPGDMIIISDVQVIGPGGKHNAQECIFKVK